MGLLYRIIGDFFSYIGDIGDIGDTPTPEIDTQTKSETQSQIQSTVKYRVSVLDCVDR